MRQAEVDVIKRPRAEELAFPAAVADLTRGAQAFLKRDLAVFLGGRREKDNLPGKRIRDLRHGEGERGAKDARHLRMMPAAVRALGLGIVKGVLRDAQRVELAEEGDARGAFFLLVQIRLSARDGEVLRDGERERTHRTGELLRSAELLVPELCVRVDVRRKVYDLTAVRVNCADDAALCLIHDPFSLLQRGRDPP